MSLVRRLLRGLAEGPGVEPAVAPPETVQALSVRLQAASVRRLGRGLALRHLDSGSCNGCELELTALGNIVYDLERFGLRFVASPRHADVLLITGPFCRNLNEAVLRTWLATPEPKWVVAVGDCAVDGGVFKGSYAIGATELVAPIEYALTIRGCPPTPLHVLEGLLALVEANAA